LFFLFSYLRFIVGSLGIQSPLPVTYYYDLNATAAYIYVEFKHFLLTLSYDPNFGVLPGGGSGDGSTGAGVTNDNGSGDGTTVGIAVGVTVPVVVIGTILVIAVLTGLSIWQRHRLVAKVRGLSGAS